MYGPFDIRRGKTSPLQLQIIVQKTPKQSPISASFPYGHMFLHWPIQVYVRDDGIILKPTIVECNYIICISYLKCQKIGGKFDLPCSLLCYKCKSQDANEMCQLKFWWFLPFFQSLILCICALFKCMAQEECPIWAMEKAWKNGMEQQLEKSVQFIEQWKLGAILEATIEQWL